MKSITLSLDTRSYRILIGAGLLKKCGAILKTLPGIGQDAFVISNNTILRLYRKDLEHSLKSASFTARFESVSDSEKAKSFDVVKRLVNKIASYDKRKSLFIIALGGGVIGDLAGFVAAIYKRGIPYIQIPTTLLAQVDSAIGGKTAIDLPVAKNMVGSFYQPRAVISDVALLSSLSARQVRNGLAEIVKYGVIKDMSLFGYLEKNHKKVARLQPGALESVVWASSRIKAAVVEADEFEKKGIRTILNYGHTIGHAIETASSYSGRYDHGEAISIGMCVAADISVKLGLMKKNDSDKIAALLKNAGLPTIIKGLSLSAVYNAHLHDKKFIHGSSRLVLPVRIGSVKVVENVPGSLISDSVKERII